MREYVVRIALYRDENYRINNAQEWLIESLRYAGIVKVHKDNETVILFDLYPPAKTVDSKVWATMNAERISSFGVNAVVAPRFKSSDPTPDVDKE